MRRNNRPFGLALLACVFCAGVPVHAGQGAAVSAQGIQPGTPPFSLSVAQLLDWSPSSPLADARNRSRVAIARRFVPAGAGGDPGVRVMFAPDGMNNLGNYLGRQDRFNLYTFAHWSQIDILDWFAGTADRTVSIPARPWIDAAHRNGVKVIGTVFFAPRRWGGSPETIEAMLRQRPDGSFPAADQLVAIARYYGFDGWLINEETSLNEGKDGNDDPALAATAARAASRMMAFMAYLKRITPAPMEAHWYDAMLPDGSVDWQNELNPRNAPLLQDGPTRRADGMFLNYQWTPAMLRSSAALAGALGRSRYDLFIGADLWPSRSNAQAAFANTHWLRDMTDPATGKAYGSIALFAPNFNFSFSGTASTPRFSDFATDPSDVARFYQAETRLFAGDRGNLAAPAAQGWPGLGALVPARGLVAGGSFRTSFNLGHGLAQFRRGARIGAAWHDMAQQDVLPTWQFSYSPGAPLDLGYTFTRAYDGGSAMRIAPRQRLASDAEVPLYALRMRPARALSVTAAGITSDRGYGIRLTFSDGTARDLALTPGRGWQRQAWCVVAAPGRSVSRLAVRVRAGVSAPLDLGALAVKAGCDRNGTKGD